METPSKRLKTSKSPRSGHKDLRKEREERKHHKKKWKEELLIRALEKQLREKKREEKRKEEESLKKEESLNNSKVEEKKEEQEEESEEEEEEEEEKNAAGRDYTVSMALPGSILDNAQSYELRTYLAGQIARAAVVFNIDEIVIFDESGNEDKNGVDGDNNGSKKKGYANIQLGRILQYLECPQYLRKFLYPRHPDLQYAGLLNPLDCPHHTRLHEDSPYREGVALDKPTRPGKGSLVNVGLRKDVEVDKIIPHGTRVTVKLIKGETDDQLKGKLVSYSTPRKELGIYWGYTVRLASCLSAAFADSPFGDYDATIGTSERGTSVDEFEMKKFNHALIVFGGVKGLEASLDADNNLELDNPKFLFPHYLNTCPTQGSRTIRTEEAILITLAALRPKINAAQQ